MINSTHSLSLAKSLRTSEPDLESARSSGNRKARRLTLALAAALIISSCATDDPNRRTKAGAAIGVLAGAVIGKQVGGDDGRLIGAAIGGLAGGAVGRYQDNQQRALLAALAEERRLEKVRIERLQDDVLRLSLSDEASFDINSAVVKPAFGPTLSKIAREVATFDKTVLHVIGFTDDTGSESYNRELATRRASAVASTLRADGVLPERIQIEGRGEIDPRVPNTSAANRAKNRRVEIYIQPIVEGDEGRALQSPTGGYS